MVDNNYYKFIDSFLFRLESEKRKINLEPGKVVLSPWSSRYTYASPSNKGLKLTVENYLGKTGTENKLGGQIRFSLSESEESVKLIVSPLIDIRAINKESPSISDYKIERSKYISIKREGKTALFGPYNKFKEMPETFKWEYKLGNGERTETEQGIEFKGEIKHPVRLGDFTYNLEEDRSQKIGFVCGKNLKDKDLEKILDQSPEEGKKEAKKSLENFQIDKSAFLDHLKENEVEKAKKLLESRIISFSSFGKYSGDFLIPEAGEWWFKEIWARDLYESISKNMESYRNLYGDKWLEKLFIRTRDFVKNGLIANKLKKEGELSYRSVDGFYLYLLSILKFIDRTGQNKKLEDLLREILDKGGDKNSLVKSKANFSWLDSNWKGKPTRIPEEWEVGSEEEFLLPEVNALRIKVLKRCNELLGTDFDVGFLFEKFKDTFYNNQNDFIYQLVYDDGSKTLKDSRESSVGVMSISLLSDFFNREELENAWETVKENLLVRRTPVNFSGENLPFGLMVINSEEKIYYNDKQYHKATVWPRDVPYLFDFLRELDKEKSAYDLLKNALDHMVSESTVFYNQELFSLPEGNNPAPETRSDNPVPVKNPVQLWSHFLDQYF